MRSNRTAGRVVYHAGYVYVLNDAHGCDSDETDFAYYGTSPRSFEVEGPKCRECPSCRHGFERLDLATNTCQSGAIAKAAGDLYDAALAVFESKLVISGGLHHP